LADVSRLAGADDTRQPTRKKRYELLIVMMTATVLLAGAAVGRVEAPDAVGGRAGAPLQDIHPSDPWPLPGHPETMKMEPPPRLFSHQCLVGQFSELRLNGVLTAVPVMIDP
jgi:hypothetical protein